MPIFGYGCAVFMQSDIVNFQRQGWRAEEILAGLAAVLPKNVFLYVASIPNLAALGSRFVLQGGTQNNLAVVKAEVDFIRSSFRAGGRQARDHRARALRRVGRDRRGRRSAALYGTMAAAPASSAWMRCATSPIAPRATKTRAATSARTIACAPSLTSTPWADDAPSRHCRRALKDFVPIAKVVKSKVPLQAGEQRLIIATCEKGTVEDMDDMKDIKAGLDAAKKNYPNFVDLAAHEAFRSRKTELVADPDPFARLDQVRQGSRRA